jgi:hypothetical protein
MTPQEWAECVVVLRSAYPTSFKLDKSGLAVWFELLRDLPGPAVQAAALHMARTTKAFPSVAEIRAYAEDRGPDGHLAWGEVVKQIAATGQYGTPTWTDPKIERAVETLGGWQTLCRTMREEDMPTWRAQFLKAYAALSERERRDQTFTALGVAQTLKALEGGVA